MAARANGAKSGAHDLCNEHDLLPGCCFMTPGLCQAFRRVWPLIPIHPPPKRAMGKIDLCAGAGWGGSERTFQIPLERALGTGALANTAVVKPQFRDPSTRRAGCQRKVG